MNLFLKIKNTFLSWLKTDTFWVIIAFIFFLATLVVFIINSNSWATQVLAACLGAIITVIVTRLLLSKQSEIEKEQKDSEDKKKRLFEMYNAKLRVYSDFVSKMFAALSDNKVEEKEILDLRTRLFGHVSFYANGAVMTDINKALSDLYTKIESFSNADPSIIQKSFSNIAELLQKDLNKDLINDWNSDSQSLSNLWNTFDGLLDKSVFSDIKESQPSFINEPINQEIDINEIKKKFNIYDNVTFWHFNAFDPNIQEKRLKQPNPILTLIEYGESWRTERLKEVNPGDVIFLFYRGGAGYVGMYRAEGIQVIESKDNTNDNSNVMVYNGKTSESKPFDDELRKNDIYEAIDDGADFVANIIVDELATKENSGNPCETVIRQTIARMRDERVETLLRYFNQSQD